MSNNDQPTATTSGRAIAAPGMVNNNNYLNLHQLGALAGFMQSDPAAASALSNIMTNPNANSIIEAMMTITRGSQPPRPMHPNDYGPPQMYLPCKNHNMYSMLNQPVDFLGPYMGHPVVAAGFPTSAGVIVNNGQKKTQYHKTKMCPWHREGRCYMGQACNYAHSKEELRPKPDLSKTRFCPEIVNGRKCKKTNCRFAHDFVELRATTSSPSPDEMTKTFYKTRICKFWLNGFCPSGDACRHAHGKEDVRKIDSFLEDGPSGPESHDPLEAQKILAAQMYQRALESGMQEFNYLNMGSNSPPGIMKSVPFIPTNGLDSPARSQMGRRHAASQSMLSTNANTPTAPYVQDLNNNKPNGDMRIHSNNYPSSDRRESRNYRLGLSGSLTDRTGSIGLGIPLNSENDWYSADPVVVESYSPTQGGVLGGAAGSQSSASIVTSHPGASPTAGDGKIGRHQSENGEFISAFLSNLLETSDGSPMYRKAVAAHQSATNGNNTTTGESNSTETKRLSFSHAPNVVSSEQQQQRIPTNSSNSQTQCGSTTEGPDSSRDTTRSGFENNNNNVQPQQQQLPSLTSMNSSNRISWDFTNHGNGQPQYQTHPIFPHGFMQFNNQMTSGLNFCAYGQSEVVLGSPPCSDSRTTLLSGWPTNVSNGSFNNLLGQDFSHGRISADSAAGFDYHHGLAGQSPTGRMMLPGQLDCSSLSHDNSANMFNGLMSPAASHQTNLWAQPPSHMRGGTTIGVPALPVGAYQSNPMAWNEPHVNAVAMSTPTSQSIVTGTESACHLNPPFVYSFNLSDVNGIYKSTDGHTTPNYV